MSIYEKVKKLGKKDVDNFFTQDIISKIGIYDRIELLKRVVEEDNALLLDLLIKKLNININVKVPDDEEYMNKLIDYACMCMSENIIIYLINNNCKVDNNTLICSIQNIELNIFEALINHCSLTDLKAKERNLFHWAAQEGREDLIPLLISKKIDINQLDEDGLTPLGQACNENNLEFAKALLKNGAKINMNDMDPPIIMSSIYGYFNICELLLAHGADVNSYDNDGRTALFYAVLYGKRDMIEFLLKKNADKNIKDFYGISSSDIMNNKTLQKEIYETIMQ